MSAAGIVVAGLPGAVGGVIAAWQFEHRKVRYPVPPLRVVLMLLIVELKSGRSALGALQGVSDALPAHRNLEAVTRMARVAGLSEAVALAEPSLTPLMLTLLRAQRTGASLTGSVRRLLESDIAADRARRIARARALPAKLMLPVTLLMLPGMLILLYAPSMVRLFDDVVGAFT